MLRHHSKGRKMTYWILALLTLVLQAAHAISLVDKASIEQIIQDQEVSWNLNECRGFGNGYSDAASFVNIFGVEFSGREEIEKRHIQILQTFLKDSKFKTLSISLSEANPEMVIAKVHWQVTGFHMPKADPSLPGETKEGMFTHVFIKMNGVWKIESSQNTLLVTPR
jgi:uncharacterized protein (TIGR02246 family)